MLYINVPNSLSFAKGLTNHSSVFPPCKKSNSFLAFVPINLYIWVCLSYSKSRNLFFRFFVNPSLVCDIAFRCLSFFADNFCRSLSNTNSSNWEIDLGKKSVSMHQTVWHCHSCGGFVLLFIAVQEDYCSSFGRSLPECIWWQKELRKQFPCHLSVLLVCLTERSPSRASVVYLYELDFGFSLS